MNKSFFLVIILIIVNCNSAFGEDSACSFFYEELSKLPHVKLTLNSNGLKSLWDGKEMPGCEVIFESHESIVSGKEVYSKFESFTHAPGWAIDNNIAADGPGSSCIGIESDKSKCIIHWSQHAWIDEESMKIMHSSHIEMIIQCSPK